ncbi:hypothetical protein ONZ45_g12315 [Pleurotus djamor]|nr:hypothetical protein ONZ45_g12315 [Pleurotus djamor]
MDTNIIQAIMISCTYTLYGRLAWKLSCNVHWFCTYFMILMILLIYGASIFAVSEVRRIQPSLEFFFNFTGAFGQHLLR